MSIRNLLLMLANSMKHSLIIAAIIIGIAGIAYMLWAEPAVAPTEPTSTGEEVTIPAESEATTSGSGEGTLADFFAADDSVYCTFTGRDGEAATSEGEFWYANQKLRVESITRVDGEVYTSNMINDGDRTFIWGGTADGAQAIVMDNELTTDASTAYEVGASDARVDMEQTIEYDCQSWVEQSAQFVPPSNINFIDVSDMMDGVFQGELRGLPEGMNF